jgi:hypothetical protein
MDYFKELIRHPILHNYEFYRFRYHNPTVFGETKPSFFTRFFYWLMDDMRTPVDWEECPPFDDYVADPLKIKEDRKGNYIVWKCETEPDMLTRKDIYIRRVLALSVPLILNHLGFKYAHFFKTFPFFEYLVRGRLIRVYILALAYYSTCKMFCDRDSLLLSI